jgi:hypothetical protein
MKCGGELVENDNLERGNRATHPEPLPNWSEGMHMAGLEQIPEYIVLVCIELATGVRGTVLFRSILPGCDL